MALSLVPFASIRPSFAPSFARRERSQAAIMRSFAPFAPFGVRRHQQGSVTPHIPIYLSIYLENCLFAGAAERACVFAPSDLFSPKKGRTGRMNSFLQVRGLLSGRMEGRMGGEWGEWRGEWVQERSGGAE